MTDTLRLLRHDPAVAVMIMANNQHNLWLRPEFTSVGPPTRLGEVLTKVLISTHPTTDPGIRRNHFGQMEYTYKRLKLDEVMNGIKLDFAPPATVASILATISKQTGLVFNENDFDNALIEASHYVLEAKSESLRWVGSVVIELRPAQSVVSLADAFSNNVLDGLAAVLNPQAPPLNDIILVDELDGFALPTW